MNKRSMIQVLILSLNLFAVSIYSFAQDQKVEKKQAELTAEQSKEIKKATLQAVNDPRVLGVVEKAQEYKVSIKADFDASGEVRYSELKPNKKITEKEKLREKYIGASLDVGAPYLAALSVVARPIEMVQFFLGFTHNIVAPGIRGGVTADFIDYWISPSATIEAGYVFNGDYNGIVNLFTGSTSQSAYLKSVSYAYESGSIGVEFGDRRTWRLSLGVGATLMQVNVHDFEKALQEQFNDKDITATDPDVAVRVLPTGKIGFKYFF